MSLIIGLTGGIGSGKSTVADIFAAYGAHIVDTDAIAHALTAPRGPAIAAIEKAFGPQYIDSGGALDRAAMRQRVFAEPDAKLRLEAILHPMIRDAANAELKDTVAPYSMLVVPLLVESGNYSNRLDRILVVDCDEDVQLARTMARSGLDVAQVRSIMASQASRSTRLAAADDVVDNTGDMGNLRAQAEALHKRYLELARMKAARGHD